MELENILTDEEINKITNDNFENLNDEDAVIEESVEIDNLKANENAAEFKTVAEEMVLGEAEEAVKEVANEAEKDSENTKEMTAEIAEETVKVIETEPVTEIADEGVLEIVEETANKSDAEEKTVDKSQTRIVSNEADKVGVYAKVNSEGFITEINSDIFMTIFEGWTKIDEGEGEKYVHAQTCYFEEPLSDDFGNYRYKL